LAIVEVVERYRYVPYLKRPRVKTYRCDALCMGAFWRGLRRKPTHWLFPGSRWHTANNPVTTKVLWSVLLVPANLELVQFAKKEAVHT
jgi:hypothetical protein